MFPPLFAILNASAPVKALLGAAPLRVYPFGAAPSKGAPGYITPYALFQTISGSPENYLSGAPDVDAWQVQVDVYADTLTAARNGAKAIRDAVEPAAYVVGYNAEYRETDTQLYRYSFDIAFLTKRP